ncbi:MULTISPECIES: hypothetical protein [unclassified Oceanobacter]|uniref:hypothetical protein n=1 Tax=unclassified Oceanobacter TaxID=2620260 RepID=UPI002734321A|nr:MULTISPECIES: hypothetical protein [unclassified Oceanobacter]MDP2610006.1 hypothetical protein [Oceanobacter sp. 1_MG-2023]
MLLTALKQVNFDPIHMTCICSAGNKIIHRGTRDNGQGQPIAYFEGRLLQCRNCNKKPRCMKNPSAANHRKGRKHRTNKRWLTKTGNRK